MDFYWTVIIIIQVRQYQVLDKNKHLSKLYLSCINIIMDKEEKFQIINSEVFTIKQALNELKISRASLYNYINKIGINPIKKGRRVYLIKKDLDHIKASYQLKNNRLNNKDTSKNCLKSEALNNKTNKIEISLKKERLKNSKLIEKIEKLSREIGQWEGTAKTLLDQNQKLIANNHLQKKSFFQRLFNL